MNFLIIYLIITFTYIDKQLHVQKNKIKVWTLILSLLSIPLLISVLSVGEALHAEKLLTLDLCGCRITWWIPVAHLPSRIVVWILGSGQWLQRQAFRHICERLKYTEKGETDTYAALEWPAALLHCNGLVFRLSLLSLLFYLKLEDELSTGYMQVTLLGVRYYSHVKLGTL